MPGYRKTKNVDAGKMKHAGMTMPDAAMGMRSPPKPKGSTNPMAGAEKMPMGDGPMHNGAGKVNKPTMPHAKAMAALVAGLQKLRQRRTNMAAGKGTTTPTSGGY